MDNKDMPMASTKSTVLFLSDVDGTLLKTREPLLLAVKNAIADFCSCGGRFAFSTGRAAPAAAALAAEIGVNAPCIVCGGAMLYDYGGAGVLASFELDDEIHARLEAILVHYPDVSITLTNGNGIYNIRMNDRLKRRGVEADTTASAALLAEVENPVKALLTCDDISALQEIGRRYFPKEKYSFNFASKHFCEITAAGVNKGSTMRLLRELCGGCRIFSAGDAHSDLHMAAESEMFFAPSTAAEEVKQHADVIIPSPMEGGIVNALQYVMKL